MCDVCADVTSEGRGASRAQSDAAPALSLGWPPREGGRGTGRAAPTGGAELLCGAV